MLLWIVHFLVLRGVQTAASINSVATLAKLLPLGLFIVLAFMLFKLDTFTLDFTGVALGVPVWEQVKTPCSSPCRYSSVSRRRRGGSFCRAEQTRCHQASATFAGSTCRYLGVTCWSPCCLWALSHVPNWRRSVTRQWPVWMVKMMGSWGEIIIAAGLIVSCAAPICWTIMAAEVPFSASHA